MVKLLDEESLISDFIEKNNSSFKRCMELISEVKQKISKKEETLKSWKKKVNSKMHDVIEWEMKLHNIDLKEKVALSEQEAQKREEEYVKGNICQLKFEVAALTVEKKRLEEDYEDRRETAVKTFKALVAAMTFYKEHLKCYIDLDKSDSATFTFVYFYDADKIKLQTEHEYFVTLDCCEGDWEVLQMKPSVPCKEEISAYLKDNGDIIGFLSHIHDAFAEIASKVP